MSGLHRLGTESLRRLRSHLQTRSGPTSAESLDSAGLAAVSASILEGLSEIPESAWLPVVDALLRQRKVFERSSPELVWTGPEAPASEARRSAIVLRQAFEQAQEHLLIAGYSFTKGTDLLEPAYRRLRDAGIEMDLYLNIEQPPAIGPPPPMSADAVRTQIDDFFVKHWPWPDAKPRVWFDRRVLDGGIWTSLHAKCVVVDRTLAYVTSANFTERGNERNVEVGVQLRDPAFAKRLADHFAAARTEGWFVAGR